MKERIISAVMIALAFIFGAPCVSAETEIEVPCWVLCQPEDYINIRSGPGKRNEVTGYAESGMQFTTDLEERNGYIHLVGVTEYGDGWICSGYVVYSQPENVDREMTVRSNGRVACRKQIDGKRRCWVNAGETVIVYKMTRLMAVTNKGFIERKYLE